MTDAGSKGPRDAGGRWLRGVSPNPGGRPKGRGLAQEIERELARKGEGKPKIQRLAEVIVSKALEGDLRACELVAKRLWPEKLALEDDAALGLGPWAPRSQ